MADPVNSNVVSDPADALPKTIDLHPGDTSLTPILSGDAAGDDAGAAGAAGAAGGDGAGAAGDDAGAANLPLIPVHQVRLTNDQVAQLRDLNTCGSIRIDLPNQNIILVWG